MTYFSSFHFATENEKSESDTQESSSLILSLLSCDTQASLWSRANRWFCLQRSRECLPRIDVLSDSALNCFLFLIGHIECWSLFCSTVCLLALILACFWAGGARLVYQSLLMKPLLLLGTWLMWMDSSLKPKLRNESFMQCDFLCVFCWRGDRYLHQVPAFCHAFSIDGTRLSLNDDCSLKW